MKEGKIAMKALAIRLTKESSQETVIILYLGIKQGVEITEKVFGKDVSIKMRYTDRSPISFAHVLIFFYASFNYTQKYAALKLDFFSNLMDFWPAILEVIKSPAFLPGYQLTPTYNPLTSFFLSSYENLMEGPRSPETKG